MPITTNASSRDKLVIAGRTFTDLNNLKVLYGYVNGSNCTMRLSDGTPYQVPGSKTFYIQALSAQARQSSAGTGLELLYSNNDVGVSTATAFTPAGPPTGFRLGLATLIDEVIQIPAANDTKIEIDLDFAVPTGKYVGITAGTGLVSVRVYGYEL